MLFNAQFEYHICIFEAYYVCYSMVLLTYSVKMTQIKITDAKQKKQTCSGDMKNAFLYHFIFFDTKLRYYSLYQSYSV